ncbi:MAG TPA: hypothetical protein VET90_03625 [Candidatus Binatus sp.]|nr:hypothetical protein [Candidatus Binatus sp.]
MPDRPAGQPISAPLRMSGEPDDPSLVALVAAGTLDGELAALVWLLVEARLPLVVAAPPARLGAAAQLLRGVLRSIPASSAGGPGTTTPIEEATTPVDRLAAWQLVHGERRGAVVGATSLEALRSDLSRAPFLLSPQELTFLGTVLVLAPPPGQLTGRLRVTAAHYVRPLARDAGGHPQELPPAVLATWDESRSRYEHFAWGVLPEIAARLGRKAGAVEADLRHRRDDLAALASAGVTSVDEVRRLIAGYQADSRAPHPADGAESRPH